MGSAQSKGVDEGGTESVVVQFGHRPVYSLVTQSPNSHLSEQKHNLGILAFAAVKGGITTAFIQIAIPINPTCLLLTPW